ncbi:GtrA family protein [Virgisporangium ochraceum]|uniref:Membrane protein n=1 Tax=Virgisporangium ochraceum TaxID=65505 RepID=A0A8J3ZY06_9ACTN|nr:GtrA family protein [Virgisporangium ochraceum]GIJ70283.1 membrane protein [Virgisporangium ochraceum]
MVTPAPAGTGDEADAASHSVDSTSAAIEVVEAAHDLDEAVHHPDTEPDDRSALRRLYDRFSHLIHELGKFGVVGSIALVIDVAIFNLLRQAGVESLTSATASMAVAATAAFVGNRFWTWRDRERSGLRREYTLYFIFNAVGLLIALICLAISTYGLGSIWPAFTTPLAENISKQIVGGALGTTFRFWSYRNIVFRTAS